MRGAVEGIIHVHPAGYGFVERDDAHGDDLFVPLPARGASLDGDRVRVAVVMGARGPEARVEDVLARGRAKLTGVLRLAGRWWMLDPDDPRVGGAVAVEGGPGGARDGQCVLAEITAYPRAPGDSMQARVARVLGEPEDPRTEVAKALAVADLRDEFPAEVVAEAARVPEGVGTRDADGRTDLRHVPFLTIDPPDARDHDDAVAVEAKPSGGVAGHRLWVAIADVSHYVRPGSALDREARLRGNSVYLPNRAIPMLPESLSAGACSLLPEDRLAMVVRIDFDDRGRPGAAKFMRAIVRPRALLPYDDVAAGRTGEHAAQVEAMRALAARLKERRAARGALELDIPEAKVVLDEDDPLRVRDVIKSRAAPEMREAYGLVEEFMLAANEAVARVFAARNLDAIWRVHDRPDEKRIAAFADLAEALGHPFAAANVTPARLRAYLVRLRGRPHEQALSTLLLRALAQARYDVVNAGHFGLAAPHYLHFTSPIRRYPDLVVHRLLAAAMGWQRGRGVPPHASSGGVSSHESPEGNARQSREELSRVSAECSRAERRAMEVEREVVDLYRAYLMRDRIGDEFDAVVTGVGGAGLFVQVAGPFVDGLVRVERLREDFFEVDESKMLLRGRRTGKVFQIGDALRVRCESVSVARRKIEFAPAWEPQPESQSDPEHARRGRGGGRRERRR